MKKYESIAFRSGNTALCESISLYLEFAQLQSGDVQYALLSLLDGTSIKPERFKDFFTEYSFRTTIPVTTPANLSLPEVRQFNLTLCTADILSLIFPLFCKLSELNAILQSSSESVANQFYLSFWKYSHYLLHHSEDYSGIFQDVPSRNEKRDCFCLKGLTFYFLLLTNHDFPADHLLQFMTPLGVQSASSMNG
jgi:hypothetical protein